jgi:hypothetical protein
VTLPPLPRAFVATRLELQRVAVHVLARRRHALSGRFGLRATPGGIGTPAAGPDAEVVRVDGSTLVRERTGARASTAVLDLRSASLADAAALVEVDLTADFSAGADTPPVDDVDRPLDLDPGALSVLAGWFALGWRVLDAAVAGAGRGAEPSVVQLWPEHFDAGCDLAAAPGRRVNLGASPGDEGHPEPYLYVGPWDAERPGDPAYWNAPFGARLPYAALEGVEDPAALALDFLRAGLGHLAAGPTG